MIHVEHELPEELRSLRSSELCAWLDLGLEHDEQGRLVPVDLVTGDVLLDLDAWRGWLADNPARVARAAQARAEAKARLRKPRHAPPTEAQRSMFG